MPLFIGRTILETECRGERLSPMHTAHCFVFCVRSVSFFIAAAFYGFHLRVSVFL